MMVEIADIIAAITAVGAFCASVYAVINSNQSQSYEHMIRHRMDTYDTLQKQLAEMWRLTTPEFINKHRKRMTKLGYAMLLNGALSEIEILLSRTEKQEFLLLGECEKLKLAALEYWRHPKLQVKRHLLQKREVVFDFADIYMWSLWQYLQRLYNNPKKKLHRLFDEEFAKTYEAAKKIRMAHTGRSHFFRKYDNADKLTDKEYKK